MDRAWKSRLHRFLRSEDGPAAVEYAVLLALILTGIIASVSSFGAGTGGMFSTVNGELNNTNFGS